MFVKHQENTAVKPATVPLDPTLTHPVTLSFSIIELSFVPPSTAHLKRALVLIPNGERNVKSVGVVVIAVLLYYKTSAILSVFPSCLNCSIILLELFQTAPTHLYFVKPLGKTVGTVAPVENK